jgi:SAM-dependent methyltransferase
MKSLEESVVTALDGSETDLLPFLPYILQDVWEIGASPEVVIELVQKHAKEHSKLKVLDLGCGKGAVSIKLAHNLKCTCYGIDAIREFIDEAILKAKEYKVDSLCKFEVGDIRIKVEELTHFDVIILGAIGPVFGNCGETLAILSKCLNTNAIIIIDDGYIENDSDYTYPLIQKRETILQQIKDSAMQFVDEIIIDKDRIKESDDDIFESLKQRCHELIEQYPERRRLFENYIKRQEEENDVLETKVVCSTMAIRKM